MTIIKQALLLGLLAAILFVANIFAFSEPSSPPPGSNTPAPLHVGATGQTKTGGLILNTGGASYGLIVDQGSVGIGTQSPSQKLTVAGMIESISGGLKFPDGTVQTSAANSLTAKVGTFSIGVCASGNQQITGVGFRPKVVIFLAQQKSDNHGNLRTSHGVMTMTEQAAVSENVDNDLSFFSTSKAIVIYQSATVSQEASYVSMDSDGFTINNTCTGGGLTGQTGSAGINVIYITMR